MGRLTQAEATDLHVESLREDKRKLTAEVARLGAEVVQLKHRLAERGDAERLTPQLQAVRADLAKESRERVLAEEEIDKREAEVADLRARAAERERLLAEGVAIVEGLWAELARLRGRAELDPADRAAILAHVLGTAGRDEPAASEAKGE